MNKQYIGDGVYVEYDNYGIKLTTENGIETTNAIYLEAEVLNNLDLYLRKMFADNKMGKQNDT